MTGHDIPRRCLCLVHSDSMVRSIVASVARDLNFPPVEVFNSPAAAIKHIPGHAITALMILADEASSLELLVRLRAGQLDWPSSLPVAILTPPCAPGQVERLLAFRPARLLLTPMPTQHSVTSRYSPDQRVTQPMLAPSVR